MQEVVDQGVVPKRIDRLRDADFVAGFGLFMSRVLNSGVFTTVKVSPGKTGKIGKLTSVSLGHSLGESFQRDRPNVPASQT